ncbi:hypothetical protein N7468_002530 [Penicillium chermesinum]|uniref:Uncharacterized protein n=1 Tax=Penicillium chermesinum TaxID=63820 RepID=A0A9W9PK43_9EURO|nr:uncharacterized protein N7468_002530 [Penicillium chermesinum]KAJ5247547.1 hypothetical protein N7468_002530 [Penicillium chermesinum]
MKPGASLLLTNMHTDIGALSQAGVDGHSNGVKIRSTSYCHSISDVVAEAAKAGLETKDFDLISGSWRYSRNCVDNYPGEAHGERANEWAGIKVWFALCFRRKMDLQGPKTKWEE